MRLHPLSIDLMILKGAKTLRGKPLWSKSQARDELRAWTGQDFGYDAKLWGAWLRKNRSAYQHPVGDVAAKGR